MQSAHKLSKHDVQRYKLSHVSDSEKKKKGEKRERERIFGTIPRGKGREGIHS